MPTSPAHPPTQRFAPAQPGDPIFIASLPCIGCGYDLRTMGLAGRCPECARPATDSFASLHIARRSDLATLISGLRLLFWPAVVPPLLGAAFLGIDIWRSTDGPQLTILGILLAGIVGPCVALPGASRLAAAIHPLPGLDAHRHTPLLPASPPLRTLAIVYACTSSAAAIISSLVMIEVPHRGPSEVVIWMMAILAIASGCAWSLRNMVLCTRAAQLCTISNRSGLSRMFTAASFIAAFGLLVFLGYGLVALMARFDLIPWSYSTLPASVRIILVFLQILVGLVNFVGLGWLVAWPLLLAVLARHITRIERTPLATAADLIGVQNDPDARFYAREGEPLPTEPPVSSSTPP